MSESYAAMTARKYLEHALLDACHGHETIARDISEAIQKFVRAEIDHAVTSHRVPETTAHLTIPPRHCRGHDWHVLTAGKSSITVAQWFENSQVWRFVGGESHDVTPGMAWDAGWRWRRVVDVNVEKWTC